jgi:hypothetical protein
MVFEPIPDRRTLMMMGCQTGAAGRGTLLHVAAFDNLADIRLHDPRVSSL